MKTKKIGLVGIYFPGAYDALHENVPEGFELVDALSPEAYGNQIGRASCRERV